VYEHDEPSEGFPVVDLSLEEKDAMPDTSRDEEIAWKIFGGLNHGLLGPPGNGVSSSTVTLMKKKRCVRATTSTLK
jgi:hypothetical protein